MQYKQCKPRYVSIMYVSIKLKTYDLAKNSKFFSTQSSQKILSQQDTPVTKFNMHSIKNIKRNNLEQQIN